MKQAASIPRFDLLGKHFVEKRGSEKDKLRAALLIPITLLRALYQFSPFVRRYIGYENDNIDLFSDALIISPNQRKLKPSSL